MITVLTPTYNRLRTLPCIFENLFNQECLNFKWIVIDDGSTDDTQALLSDFENSALFIMHVIQQPNSGKHVAINVGIFAEMEDWIFIVDSDDALTPDAITIIEEKLVQLNSDNLVGLAFRKAYFNGEIIGKKIVGPNVIKQTPIAAGALFKGDLAYVFKKDSLLKNPFPVIPGEKFIPELYIWNKISDGDDIYFFVDKYIYLC
jgi:glycosyltransferase involved in cell wall biosynthesis